VIRGLAILLCGPMAVTLAPLSPSREAPDLRAKAAVLALEARALAGFVDDTSARDAVLSLVARVLVRTGHLTGSLHAALRIQDIGLRALALAPVVAALVEGGRVREAQEVVRSLGSDEAQYRAMGLVLDARGVLLARLLQDASWRERALADIAAAMARADRAADAITLVAQEASRPDARDRVLLRALAVLAASPRAHRVEAEEALALALHDPSRRARALVQVVERYLEGGRIDEARAALRPITDPHDRARALAAVASRMADRGRVEEARELALEARGLLVRVRSRAERDRMAAWVAPALADARALGEARELTSWITTPRLRAMAVAGVIGATLRTGPFVAPPVDELLEMAQDALATAGAIPERDERLRIAASVLAPLLRNGKGEDVLEVVERARDPVRTLGVVGFLKALTESHTAWRLASAQDWTERALRTSRTLLDLRDRDLASALASQAFAEAHRPLQAIQVAQQIRDPEVKSKTLGHLAQGRTPDGRDLLPDPALAAQIADSIPVAEVRNTALHAVALRFARVGRFTEARSLLGGIRDGPRRSAALAELAVLLARAGRVREFRDVVTGMAATPEGRSALVELVRTLADDGLIPSVFALIRWVPVVRDHGLRSIAVRWARTRPAEAERLAREIRDLVLKARALVEIAWALL